MGRKLGYRWNLRILMAVAGMYATSDLVPLLAERGVVLSAAQVYRLATRRRYPRLGVRFLVLRFRCMRCIGCHR